MAGCFFGPEATDCGCRTVELFEKIDFPKDAKNSKLESELLRPKSSTRSATKHTPEKGSWEEEMLTLRVFWDRIEDAVADIFGRITNSVYRHFLQDYKTEGIWSFCPPAIFVRVKFISSLFLR